MSTYRAVGPGLERAIVAGLNSLNGDVLVASKGCDNCRLVRERDLVVRVRGEEALEKRGGRVENRGALATDFDADGDLSEVDEVGTDTTDV